MPERAQSRAGASGSHCHAAETEYVNIVIDAESAGVQAFHEHAWRRLDPEQQGGDPKYCCDLCPATWPAQRRPA